MKVADIMALVPATKQPPKQQKLTYVIPNTHINNLF